MEQTLMGETEFANAMVPPSPPRSVNNLSTSPQSNEQSSSANNKNPTSNSNNNSNAPQGIAATGSSKRRKTNGPAVPRLKISDFRQPGSRPSGGGGSGLPIIRNHPNAIVDSDEEDDGADKEEEEEVVDDEEEIGNNNIVTIHT